LTPAETSAARKPGPKLQEAAASDLLTVAFHIVEKRPVREIGLAIQIGLLRPAVAEQHQLTRGADHQHSVQTELG